MVTWSDLHDLIIGPIARIFIETTRFCDVNKKIVRIRPIRHKIHDNLIIVKAEKWHLTLSFDKYRSFAVWIHDCGIS